ncbi:MAG: hypothetical protein EA370_10255, partial [Wenzhouxiangella sp.]
QTGRKLVMDYYGPRVPLGGGALCGKHPTHIDRIGARAAREAAVHAVRTGAGECLVQVTYAPNCDLPLDVNYRMEGRGERLGREFFGHESLVERSLGQAPFSINEASQHLRATPCKLETDVEDRGVIHV